MLFALDSQYPGGRGAPAGTSFAVSAAVARVVAAGLAPGSPPFGTGRPSVPAACRRPASGAGLSSARPDLAQPRQSAPPGWDRGPAGSQQPAPFSPRSARGAN